MNRYFVGCFSLVIAISSIAVSANAHAFGFERWISKLKTDPIDDTRSGLVYIKDRSVSNVFGARLSVVCNEDEPFSTILDFGDASAVFKEKGKITVRVKGQEPTESTFFSNDDDNTLKILDTDVISGMTNIGGNITFRTLDSSGEQHTHTFHLKGFRKKMAKSCRWHSKYEDIIG